MTVTNFMKNRSVLATYSVLGLTLLMASTANAQPQKKPINLSGVKVGINAISANHGFSNYSNSIKILPSIFYEGQRVYVRGNQLGYKVFSEQGNELAIIVQSHGVAYNPKKTTGGLKELDQRKTGIFAGASYMQMTPVGGIRGQFITEAIGDSGGTIARLSYVGRFKDDMLTLYPSAGVQWQNTKYNNHYYGVTEKESIQSGIPQYSPSGSLNPYVSVMGMYDVDQKWGVFLNQNIAYNTDKQVDSPKVDSRLKTSSMVGLTYNF